MIIREPNLTTDEHAMLDEFEIDLERFLREYNTPLRGETENEEGEIFFEFEVEE